MLQANPFFLDLSHDSFAFALVANGWGPSVNRDDSAEPSRFRVAEQWHASLGIPAKWRNRALVTDSRASALRTLMRHWASCGMETIAFPAESGRTVSMLLGRENAGLTIFTYPTVPTIDHRYLCKTDVMVITNPVSPRGSALSVEEMQTLQCWLDVDPKRRLVVDAESTIDNVFLPETLELYASDQVYVLHSLGEGWLAADVAAFVLPPAQDMPQVKNAIREQPCVGQGLAQADLLLRHAREYPRQLGMHLLNAEAVVRTRLEQSGIQYEHGQGLARYQFVVQKPFEDLARDNGILARPLNALKFMFGRSRVSHEYSVVSLTSLFIRS